MLSCIKPSALPKEISSQPELSFSADVGLSMAQVLRRQRIVVAQSCFQFFQALALRVLGDSTEIEGEIKKLLDILNPEDRALPADKPFTRSPNIHVRPGRVSTDIKPTEQKWALLDPIANALTSGMKEFVLIARNSALQANLECEAGLSSQDPVNRAFELFIQKLNSAHDKIIAERFPSISVYREALNAWEVIDEKDPSGASVRASGSLNRLKRTLQVCLWIGETTANQERVVELDRQLGEFFENLGPQKNLSKVEDPAFAIIDGWVNTWCARLGDVNEPVSKLLRIMTHRAVNYPKEDGDYWRKLLPPDHHIGISVERLYRRLEAGAVSAVGGNSYVRLRYLRHILNSIATASPEERTALCVCFNGSHEEGIDFALQHMMRLNPKLKDMGSPLATPIPGLYGSFERSYLQFPDSSVALLVSSWGESRQLSHASTLLLYSNQSEVVAKSTISPEQIILAESAVSCEEKLHLDFNNLMESAHSTSLSLLAERSLADEPIINQLVISQTPDEVLTAGDEEKLLFVEDGEGESFGKVRFFYYREDDGSVLRRIVPLVGGSGLYGKSSGNFVGEFLKLDNSFGTIDPNIYFTATAGGFRNTDGLCKGTSVGLGDVNPGDLIAPMSEIVYEGAEGDESLRIPTLLNAPVAFQRFGIAEWVNPYSSHWCVEAPAFETEDVIEQRKKSGISGVDVECYWIAKAVHAARSRGIAATFTPIYILSDDPSEAFLDPSATLGFNQIYHERVSAHPNLSKVLRGLFSSSRA